MEYVDKSFQLYRDYLERNKERFPLSVFEFSYDLERHTLNSPHSLHDSWLTSITVRENRKGGRPFEPDPTIELILLGQMHDRDIVLTYRGIVSYVVTGNRNPYNYADTFLGDISCHEVRVTDAGFLMHEIEFVSDSRIIITCETFECVENEHT